MKSYPISERELGTITKAHAARIFWCIPLGLGIGAAISTYGLSLCMSTIAVWRIWHANQITKGLLSMVRARTDGLNI